MDIGDYHELGLHLGIEYNKLKQIEHKNQNNPNQQLSGIIAHWKKNEDCSWEALATALDKFGTYKKLVGTLRQLGSASKSEDKPQIPMKDSPRVADKGTPQSEEGELQCTCTCMLGLGEWKHLQELN